MKKHTKVLARILFSLGFILICYIAFYQLGKAPFENWDEAWYAAVTRTMLQTHEFVALYWNGEMWLDKPPMYMWLSSFFASIFGLSEFSMRLTSALSGVTAVMLVTWFAYKHYGVTPAILAYITLALNNVFVARMRSGNIDTLPALLMLLIFFALVSKHAYRYVFLGVLFAVLYMTRGAMVVFPLVIFILHEILFMRKGLVKHAKQYGITFLTATVIPAIWLLIGYFKGGGAYVSYFLWQSDRGVASVALANFHKDYFMYTYYSLQRRFAFVLISGVLFALRYIKDNKAFLMLLFGLGLIIQLSFTDRNNNWYLVPAMPFWSLLIAYGTYHILKIVKNHKLAVAGILALSLFVGYRTFTINITPILDTTGPVKLVESAKQLQKIVPSDEAVVRLDHLYPTTIYYSQRKIYASPSEAGESTTLWMTRADLIAKVKAKKIRWIAGSSSETAAFAESLPDVSLKTIHVNDEETILHVR